MNQKDNWHSGREFGCSERGTWCEPGCPKFCTKGNVRKCPPGHLLEKNQEMTWWPKQGVRSHQVSFWTTKTAVSNMKVHDCKAECYSVHLRYGRSLRQNNSLRGKWIFKHLGPFSEQESEKNHIITKNERFLTSFMYTRKNRALCRFMISKGI